VLDQIVKYRNLGTLNDGTRVLLRPLTKDDRERLVEFFAPVSPDDLRYLRHNIGDAGLVRRWVDELDYQKILPLVAVVSERIVGETTLHFREGPERHIAEIRIFLSKEFRRRGLGTLMLKAIVDIARKVGLQQLVAEVVADQTQAIKAFLSLGFKTRCTLDDYFILPDGETRDVVLLVLPLVSKQPEF